MFCKKAHGRAVVAVFTLAFLFSGVLLAAPLKRIASVGVLRAASEGAFPPFNVYKGKQLTGFEIEVVDAVAKELKLKVQWSTFPFDALLIGLDQDRYDLVAASHGITPERTKAVDFSRPHYCTGGVILTRKGGPVDRASLVGKKVAVQVGTTYLTALQKIPGVKEVKTYPKDTDSLQSLAAGRVDAMVTDKFSALEVVKSQQKLNLLTGELLFEERVGMAISKGNKELLSAVNTALETLMKNGTYQSISQKYFGQDVRCP